MTCKQKAKRIGAAKWIVPALAAAILSWSLPVRPAGDELPPWQITADRITHEKKPSVITAEGKVVLRRERPGLSALEIRADWIRHRIDINTVEARGHVELSSGRERLTAAEAILDLVNQTGTLIGTTLFLPENNLHFQGDHVEKTGELTYRFTDGWISSCPPQDGESQAWRILARQADLTLEGYARLRHATLEIRGIPILYTPYLVIPAKTVRATGFLFTEISSSRRDGAGILAPFFVNLSPSSDLTLYPGYLEKRGVQLGAEFRYIADRRSRGTFRASFLHDTRADTVEDDYLDDGYLRATRDRYWLRGKADQYFGGGITGRADFDVVSDRDFLREYREGPLGYDRDREIYLRDYHRDMQEESLPFRTSSLQLTRSRDHLFLGVETLAVKDVWDEPAAVTPLQVLPRLRSSGSMAVGQAAFAWQGEFVHYWRREGVGAQRLDLFPRFVTPLPLGPYLEGSAAVGVRETLYHVDSHGRADWAYDDFQQRTVWSLAATVASTLYRDYDAGGWHGWQRLTHAIRPEVVYRYAPDPDQVELPDLDATDRLAAVNMLQYGLTSTVNIDYRDTATGGLGSRRLGVFRVRQSYDIKEARRQAVGEERRPFSDILFELDCYPTDLTRLSYDTTVSVHGQGVTSYDFVGQWYNDRNEYLRLRYRYKLNPDQLDPFFYLAASRESRSTVVVSARKHFLERLALEGRLAQSLDNNRTVTSSVRALYTPACWSMEVDFSHSAAESRLAIMFTLEGLGRAPSLGFSDL